MLLQLCRRVFDRTLLIPRPETRDVLYARRRPSEHENDPTGYVIRVLSSCPVQNTGSELTVRNDVSPTDAEHVLRARVNGAQSSRPCDRYVTC